MANEKRLTDTETVIRKLRNANCAECNVVRKIQCSACWVDDVVSLLEDAPTVDAVEVVRCKDCKRYSQSGLCNLYLNISPEMKPNDFCSYGERREGE